MCNYPLYLAPMEDVTDIDFRLLCKEHGADRVYTEFINADALIRDVESTVRKICISDAERPVSIQIYGSGVDSIVAAAKIVEEVHPDFIDLNFGCPVKKIANKGAGAGLLLDIDKLLHIADAVVKNVNIPVTAKTRLGWNDSDLHSSRLQEGGNSQPLILDLAYALQDCGIAELTIHGRTRAQMYTGVANWELIGQVKNDPRIHIPVIGNGDITNGQQAYACFKNYNVDAIMIGRASFGYPWIFEDIKQYIAQCEEEKGVAPLAPQQDMQKGIHILKKYVEASILRIGDEKKGIIHSRRHFAHSQMFKGLPSFRSFKLALLQACTKQDVFDILDKIGQTYDRYPLSFG